MCQARGAAVLLHVEAEQGVAVIEQAVAVRVPVDGRVRHAVAVVRGRGIVQQGRARQGDRGVDRVVPAREVDCLKVGQRRDLIGGGATVERTGLVFRIADGGAVRVCQDVVVGEDVHPPQRVPHARADGAGGDRRMPHREPRRGGSLALGGIAEGHEPAGDPLGDGDAVERHGQAGYPRAFQQDLHAGPPVRQDRDRRPHHTGDVEDRVRVAPQHRDGGAEVRSGAARAGWRRRKRTGGGAVGACVPQNGAGTDQNDDGSPCQRADDNHGDSRVKPDNGRAG